MGKTPSYYENENEFRYLSHTSYYKLLQNTVEKIIGFISPGEVLELGCALGTTTLALAKKYEDICFEAVDIRKSIIKKAQSETKRMRNCNFSAEDMRDTVKGPLSGFDLIFMLYSFHHIPDPVENKEEFLKDCYKNMRKSARLLIAESFLPEEIKNKKDADAIREWFMIRAQEGCASTFWAYLTSLTQKSMDTAYGAAQASALKETQAGLHVYKRDEEYLVRLSELKSMCEQAGFKIILAEPVNGIGEAVLLAEK